MDLTPKLVARLFMFSEQTTGQTQTIQHQTNVAQRILAKYAETQNAVRASVVIDAG